MKRWIVAVVVSFLQVSPVHGFGVFTSPINPLGWPSGVGDLLANPNDFASWDPDRPGGNVTTITYRFDPSFTTDERIRDQVRLGIQEWDKANVTLPGAPFSYSYWRNNGKQNFYDIRSTTVHELGHNLGFAHPFDVVPLGRNYGFNPTPPPTLIAQPDRGDEVMGYGPPGQISVDGSYNQILSHDELYGYQYVYGNRDINFIEITSGTPDILLRTQTAADPRFFIAFGPPTAVPRDPADPTQGVQITSAQIVYYTDLFNPLGFRTLCLNWDFHSASGKDTSGVEIQTRGTNNPNPVAHFDGDPVSYVFAGSSTSSTGDPDHKDDLLHTWNDPEFWGFPSEFPPGAPFHVGLEQDVWDWTVVSARLVHPDGTKTNLPMVVFNQWNETVTGVDVTTSSAGIIIPDPLPEIIAEGIRIVNTEDARVELFSVGVAVVDEMDLQLEDLNQYTMYRLTLEGFFETLDILPRTLGKGEELFLVFDGSPTGIDSTILLDRPDLLGHELFFYAETSAGDMKVGNYGLLGTGPIVGVLVPEPSTLVLAVVGLLGLLAHAWRKNGGSGERPARQHIPEPPGATPAAQLASRDARHGAPAQ